MTETPMPAEPDRLPPAAIQAATDDLTAWMLKWCWLPADLTTAQHGEVCREAASRVLEVGAPILADAVARAILSHMDEHWPADYFAGKAPRRLFQAAARVAAGAFTTEAESKQMAARALAAGQYVACPLPEDGVPRDA